MQAREKRSSNNRKTSCIGVMFQESGEKEREKYTEDYRNRQRGGKPK